MCGQEESAPARSAHLVQVPEESALQCWVQVVLQFLKRVKIRAGVGALERRDKVQEDEDQEHRFQSRPRPRAREWDASLGCLVEEYLDFPVRNFACRDTREGAVGAEDGIQVTQDVGFHERFLASFGVLQEVVDRAGKAFAMLGDGCLPRFFRSDVAFGVKSAKAKVAKRVFPEVDDSSSHVLPSSWGQCVTERSPSPACVHAQGSTSAPTRPPGGETVRERVATPFG